MMPARLVSVAIGFEMMHRSQVDFSVELRYEVIHETLQ